MTTMLSGLNLLAMFAKAPDMMCHNQRLQSQLTASWEEA